MSTEQLWALLAFAAVMGLLSLGLWPRPARWRGQQKYRKRAGPDTDRGGSADGTIKSPFALLGAILTGGAVSQSGSGRDGGGDDFSADSGDSDSGDSGGGDGGGGK